MSFQHAPVTKGLMMGCALTSIAGSIFDVKHFLHLQLVPHIYRYHQYWRLPVHHLAFSNSSELLLAEILMYHVAVPIERIFGSSKFASFCFVSTLTATILEFSALLIFNRFGLNVLPCGPIPLVFSILYQFSRLVPRAYSFRVFGVTVSNKIFMYILALQLVISQPPGSVASALIGIISSQLYRSDSIGLKAFRLPMTLQRFASRFLLPLIGSTKPQRRSNRAFPDEFPRSRRSAPPQSLENTEVVTTSTSAPAASTGTATSAGGTSATSSTSNAAAAGQSMMREWVDELTGRTDRAATGLRVPGEAEISQLMSMFPDMRREDVVGALQRSPNIETAVETLLASHT